MTPPRTTTNWIRKRQAQSNQRRPDTEESHDASVRHANRLYERFSRNDYCVLAGKFSFTGVFTL
jgi:hypothetical protein